MRHGLEYRHLEQMVNRPVPPPDIQRIGYIERGNEIKFRRFNRRHEIEARRQMCGNRRCASTPGTMGIARRNSLTFAENYIRCRHERIVSAITREVPPLHQCRRTTAPANLPSLVDKLGKRLGPLYR